MNKWINSLLSQIQAQQKSPWFNIGIKNSPGPKGIMFMLLNNIFFYFAKGVINRLIVLIKGLSKNFVMKSSQ